MKCAGEDPKDAEIARFQCMTNKKAKDLETCKQEREQYLLCDKKCDGEDPKQAELGMLECQLAEIHNSQVMYVLL